MNRKEPNADFLDFYLFLEYTYKSRIKKEENTVIDVESLSENAVEGLAEDMKKTMKKAIKDALSKDEYGMDELIAAYKGGQLSKEEFDMEMEREKQLVEAELLTMQFCSKADMQKVVNKVFEQIEQSL